MQLNNKLEWFYKKEKKKLALNNLTMTTTRFSF